jgi:hypothetical protein
MQVVHTIKLSPEECELVFSPAEKYGAVKDSTAYTLEERVMKQAEFKTAFEEALHKIVSEAFEYGYNVGANTANTKDTEMYKPGV